jgi:hypothetical protein
VWKRERRTVVDAIERGGTAGSVRALGEGGRGRNGKRGKGKKNSAVMVIG